MAVPKKKTSKKRQRDRRSQAHGKAVVRESAVCSNCNAKVMPHRICPTCGYYKGRKIIAKLV